MFKGQTRMPQAGKMILTGRVAWFDIKKQFGFVQVPGLRDTFLHMSVLKQAGYTFVPPGTTVRFTVETAQNKPRVVELLSVDTSTADPGEPEPVRRKAAAEIETAQ
jgi:CspA family cold shock protein